MSCADKAGYMKDVLNRAETLMKHMDDDSVVSFTAATTVIRELCDALRSESAEGRDRAALIDWWRERYNNLVSVMSVAVDGGVIDISDNIEFPLSDGAKTVLTRIAALDPASTPLGRLNPEPTGDPALKAGVASTQSALEPLSIKDLGTIEFNDGMDDD